MALLPGEGSVTGSWDDFQLVYVRMTGRALRLARFPEKGVLGSRTVISKNLV